MQRFPLPGCPPSGARPGLGRRPELPRVQLGFAERSPRASEPTPRANRAGTAGPGWGTSSAFGGSCEEQIPGMLPLGRRSRSWKGGRRELSTAGMGQKCPWEQLGQLCLESRLGLPRSPCTRCCWGGMRKVPPGPDPRRVRRCPDFGPFSSPSHPHERCEGIFCFTELFVAALGSAVAPPSSPWSSFLPIKAGAAFVLLSQKAAGPKPAAGKVRVGQGRALRRNVWDQSVPTWPSRVTLTPISARS